MASHMLLPSQGQGTEIGMSRQGQPHGDGYETQPEIITLIYFKGEMMVLGTLFSHKTIFSAETTMLLGVLGFPIVGIPNMNLYVKIGCDTKKLG